MILKYEKLGYLVIINNNQKKLFNIKRNKNMIIINECMYNSYENDIIDLLYELESDRKLKSMLIKKDDLKKLKQNLRNIISQSIRKNGFKKQSKTSEILGCPFDQFKLYLESKFEPWMSWDNYGLYNGELNYGWDIDHIIPLSSGKKEEDIIKLNHYLNLQPLCSYTNRYVKKDKIDY